jgi:L-idonate 5-dehydrogenase
MKAIVIHQAHDLRIDERSEEMPEPGQILVGIGRGGICGSDLHYYHHGGFGTINNGLIIMGLDVSEQNMISGGLIILAVAFGRRPSR